MSFLFFAICLLSIGGVLLCDGGYKFALRIQDLLRCLLEGLLIRYRRFPLFGHIEWSKQPEVIYDILIRDYCNYMDESI
ncbi:hypothetical protein ACFL6U_27390 [Planctomycetota bacterium]